MCSVHEWYWKVCIFSLSNKDSMDNDDGYSSQPLAPFLWLPLSEDVTKLFLGRTSSVPFGRWCCLPSLSRQSTVSRLSGSRVILWTPTPLILSNNTNLPNMVPCCVFPFCASCQLPARNIASLHSNVSINISAISWCSISLYLVLICTTACICAVQKDASRIHFLSLVYERDFWKSN